jgi:hypothetical protein
MLHSHPAVNSDSAASQLVCCGKRGMVHFLISEKVSGRGSRLMRPEYPDSPHKGGLSKEETKRKSYASAITAFKINAVSFVVFKL